MHQADMRLWRRVILRLSEKGNDVRLMTHFFELVRQSFSRERAELVAKDQNTATAETDLITGGGLIALSCGARS